MVIVEGGNEAMRAILGGPRTQAEAQFFETQYRNAMSFIGNKATDIGTRLVDSVTDIYNRFNGSRAMEIGRAALNQIRGFFELNTIQRYESISDFQALNVNMQRWVMANPYVRQRYLSQTIDGYSDTYRGSMDKTEVLDKHYDYRRVMDGMVVEEDGIYYANNYLDVIIDPRDELTAKEQFMTLDNWDRIERMIMRGGKDPTSPWNTDL